MQHKTIIVFGPLRKMSPPGYSVQLSTPGTRVPTGKTWVFVTATTMCPTNKNLCRQASNIPFCTHLSIAQDHNSALPDLGEALFTQQWQHRRAGQNCCPHKPWMHSHASQHTTTTQKGFRCAQAQQNRLIRLLPRSVAGDGRG